MEEFTDWLTERTVGLTSVIGLSGSTFDISDRILVISLLVSLDHPLGPKLGPSGPRTETNQPGCHISR